MLYMRPVLSDLCFIFSKKVIIHVIITVEFAMAIQFGEVDTNLYVQTRYVQICAGSLMQ